VAYQTARKARATRAKRRLREAHVPDAREPEAASGVRRNDLAEFLDHELSRLPAKYRTPIVLCELEGNTHGEAAERLGWPIGTVSGRLSRAKAMLAKRLTRRGLSLAGGSLAVLLAQNQLPASTAVPASLHSSTVKAAILFAAGRAVPVEVVSAEVATLTKEVLKAMLFSKLKFTTAITTAVLLALTLAGGALWQASSWADERAQPDAGFRVTVNEVIRDASTVVTQVDIETLSGSTVEVFTDKNKGGGSTLSSDAADPNRRNGLSRVQVTIFADQVEWKGGATAVVKFMLGTKIGAISNSTSDTGPMPAGAKQLSDFLTVPIKSGEYKYGQATTLVTFKGVTYSFVANRPR
jgi:hypothetical protein